jgi:hypothetical protein
VKETALILTDAGEAIGVAEIAKVLRFFGVGSRVSTVAEFSIVEHRIADSSSKLRLFCSADGFGRLIGALDQNPGAMHLWREHVHSVFVYAANDATVNDVARRIINDGSVSLIQMDSGGSQWIVSEKAPQICGVMSGIRIPLGDAASEGKVHGQSYSAHDRAFVKGDYQSVPVFLSTCSEIIDIDAALTTRNFEIRDHLLTALPIVMYVKWALADMCWASPECNACVVLDDPLLRPQYGFLNYRDLLSLMGGHNFTTSIAFIPWNWRRSNSAVAGMFKSHPERYSLSIHGCDHTGGEFGTQNVDKLAWKSRQAIERMSRHTAKTGIPYDRIMVFPQGVFSGTALAVLKQAHFTAAVNTEVLSGDLPRQQITISDVWDLAVMKYNNFPIFTRRYPSQGIENFAFDVLLGKPCIVVVHHDYCQDKSRRLVELIERLNALNCQLSWRSLGEVVKRSWRQREVLPGIVEVEMYGSELRLYNRSDQRRRYLISKREFDASTVKGVCADSREVPWKFLNGKIHFEVELASGGSTSVGITFHDSPAVRYREKIGYKLKVRLRRYLSEVRDNYVMTRRTASREPGSG